MAITETTITTAAHEYYRRPADERYASLDALVEHARHERELSAERGFNLKDLRVSIGMMSYLTLTRGEQTVVLQSPRGHAELNHWSFGQLCRMVGAPTGYLRGRTPATIAQCLNEGIDETAPGTTATVLVRGANGRPLPLVRSITSQSYGRVWDSELYGSLASVFQRSTRGAGDHWILPPTWDGQPAGAYRGDRDAFVIVVNGGSIVEDPSLASRGGSDARMFRGLLVRNSEVGACSVTIESVLYRYICGNHMLWGAIVDSKFRRRHVGVHTLRDSLRELGRLAVSVTTASVQRDEAIVRALIDHEIATTEAGVIDELRKIGFSTEMAQAAYDRCVETESALSPRSYWGIAQGATRLSQESGYQDDRLVLDRLAAAVMARGARRVAA